MEQAQLSHTHVMCYYVLNVYYGSSSFSHWGRVTLNTPDAITMIQKQAFKMWANTSNEMHLNVMF